MNQKITTYFNWHELKIAGRGDLAAIICLAYAQTFEYNELSSKTMLKRLNLNHIPVHLFGRNKFRQYKHVLTCEYKTKDPQSYFNNSSFLFTNASARYKVVYLRALSMRTIGVKDNFIPRYYYPQVEYNPFLTLTDDKIYFPLEKH